MTIQEVIKKIDRYLKKDNVEPLIVDVQNKADLEAIIPFRKRSLFSSCWIDTVRTSGEQNFLIYWSEFILIFGRI